jgi:hypothetical protein
MNETQSQSHQATERALLRAGQLIVTLMGEVEYMKLTAEQEAAAHDETKAKAKAKTSK